MIQLAHLYMTTGKTIHLSRQTIVWKVMSLLCNTLSRLVITFLPRSKRLLISWLQSLVWDHINLQTAKAILRKKNKAESIVCHDFKLYCKAVVIKWRRKWQPTPVYLPGESHGQRSLVGCSPWGRKELGTTEQLTLISLTRDAPWLEGKILTTGPPGKSLELGLTECLYLYH